MYILAIDQGTTGSRAIIFNKNAEIIQSAYHEFIQIYPKPGWVEHDPIEIWNSVKATIKALSPKHLAKVEAVGITNQRETTVVWDKTTGIPANNAIVWQCRRTANYCNEIFDKQDLIRSKTGLPIDAYFSGTKIKWILDNCEYKNSDDLLFGTIDAWLIWKLTKGAIHATDYTNASRTMIFNIHTKTWDKEICDLLNIPMEILPEVKNSSDYFGKITSIDAIFGLPILGVAGDQQAALFGQACFDKGTIKNTYGTGCFIMLNTGQESITSKKGLITTLAIDAQGKPAYALEGAIFIGGAVIQWLRDAMGIISNASDSEKMALSISDSKGVYFVPAFVGLGTPHWDMEARGIITGLTRGVNKNHIVRAALESMAFQTNDVLETMHLETGLPISYLNVDGGASCNDFLMQFQSDISSCEIIRPVNQESTALGAAFLAGLHCGFWKNCEELKNIKVKGRNFSPNLNPTKRGQLIKGWQIALKQTMAK